MVRFVLIACVLGSLATQLTCYRPSLVDCANTCSQTQLCPEGLSCVDGFCTAGTACSADASTVHDSWLDDVQMHFDAQLADATADAALDAALDAVVLDASIDAPMIDGPLPDAMPDAMVMVDAPLLDASVDAAPADAAACPPVPTSSPCAATSPPPVMPYCFTVCTMPQIHPTAAMFTSGPWHAAVINDATPEAAAAEEAAAVAALGGNPVAWLGLIQPMTAVTPADGWHWIMQPPGTLPFPQWANGQPDDMDMTENHAEDCGAITSAGWIDDNCNMTHPFLIEPF